MKPRHIHNSSTVITKCFAVTAVMLLAHAAQAADSNGTWTKLTSGNATGIWSDADTANWSGGTVADGIGFTANFSTLDITATSTVSLGASRTIGNLTFGDTAIASNAAGWVLDNGGDSGRILTLAGTAPTITVNQLNGSANTTISAGVTGAAGLIKAGVGSLVLSGPVTLTNGVTVRSGSLNFSGTGSIAGSISNASTLTVGANVAMTGATAYSQTGVGAVTSLSGNNSALSFPISISGGHVNATNSATTDVLQALGTGTITFAGSSTLRLIANSSTTGSQATAIVVGNDVVVAGPVGSSSTLIARRSSGSGSNKIFEFDALTIGGGQTLGILGRDGYGVRFTGATTLSGNTMLNPSNANLTLAGAVGDGSSGYGLAKTGTSTLFLTGTNTYSGATTIFSGVLEANDAASLPTNSNLVLNGGVLQTTAVTTFDRALGTGSDQIKFGVDGGGFAARSADLTVNIGGGPLVWNSTANFLVNGAALILGSSTADKMVDFQNAINLNGAARTVTVNGTISTALNRISGVISNSTGTASLVKSGAGTLRLSGVNTYTGTTTVKEGSLMLEATTGSLDSASDLTFSGTGAFDYNNTAAAGARSQSLDALTFSKGDGTVQATRVAAQDVSLSLASLSARATGATGNFVVSGGTNGSTNKIVLGGVSTGLMDGAHFFGGGNYAYYDGGGFVRALNYGGDSDTVALTGSDVTLGAVTNASVQYTGSAFTGITTTVAASAGATTLTLTSVAGLSVGQVVTNANIAAGTYITAIDGGLNTITLSQGVTSTIALGGTVVPYSTISAPTPDTIKSLKLAGSTSGSVILAAGDALATNRILRSGGSGTYAISGGAGSTLQAAANEEIIIRTDVAADSLTIAVPIVGSGVNALTKSGAGTLFLREANTYTGTTYVNGGTLSLSGIAVGTTVVGGNVEINGGTVSNSRNGANNAIATSANVTLNAGGYTQNTSSGSNIVQTFAGYTQNAGTTNIVASNGSSLVTVTGTTILNGGTWTVGAGGQNGSSWTTAAMQINGGVNTIGVNGNNGGTIQLTVSGGLTISQTATGPFTALTIANGTGSATSVTPQMLLSGGGLTYTPNADNPFATTIASVNYIQGNTVPIIRLTGTQTFNIGGHTGSSSPDLVIQPNITTGGIDKTGLGVLVLEGSNSYTGTTTVSAGTLLIMGSTAASSAVSVAASGTLGGTGTVAGAITAVGTIAPGASVGTLTTGTVNLAGGTLAIEIDGATGDKLLSTGTIDLSGTTLTVDEIGVFTGPYVIAEGTSVTGTMTVPPGYLVDTTSGTQAILTKPGGGPTNYANWASANGVTGGVNGDSDNDGIQNGVEYGLNTNPAGSDGSPGTYLGNVLTFDKRDATSSNGDLSYRIEVSTDLGIAFPWAEVGGYVTNDPDVISANIPTGPTKNFARLRVVVAP